MTVKSISTTRSRLVISRRSLTKGGLAALGLGATGLYPRLGGAQAKTTTVTMQLGWLAGDNQIGEVVAKQLGYFEAEKIDLVINAGGPNIDGVAIVASGRADIGQVSSSPSLMLAASQSIPTQCFAVGCQQHPYSFISLKKNPVHKPEDMIGKKVGVQATGKILLSALLRKNNVPEDKVEVVVVGADMTPLLTGQVDVFTGWLTNTTAMRVLGDDYVAMRLWDEGVQLYGLPYYATKDTLTKNLDVIVAFTRASSKGWAYAYQNPEQAVDLLLKEYPNLVKADENVAVKTLNTYVFQATTKKDGWGTFSPAVWQGQIDLYDQLKQFPAAKPKLEDVISTAVLDATKDTRPKLG
ncbi:MAG TPA: ABC transporter substrate-binding protein [Magnetospirillaceae bacterium]|jgi:NitT/TauT family transport system substrate-binding protein